jgi:hypothetical protein
MIWVHNRRLCDGSRAGREGKPRISMAFDAFISYSHTDKATADAACATLERAGIRCWIAPRDVPPGSQWAGAIIGGIDQCRVMVLIFSSHANASNQIHREVERAASKGIPIIPLRIEDANPTSSLEYFLGSIHWLDALTPPLEKHLQRLAETVTACLAVDRRAAAAPGTEPVRTAPLRDAPRRQDQAARPAMRGRRWALVAATTVLSVMVGGAALLYLKQGTNMVAPAPEAAAPPGQFRSASEPGDQRSAAASRPSSAAEPVMPRPERSVAGPPIVAPRPSPPTPCDGGAVTVSSAPGCARPLSADEEGVLNPKDTFKECDNCPEMVVVPAGRFTMGSPRNEAGRYDLEAPQHEVTFKKHLAVGKFTEVELCLGRGFPGAIRVMP